MLDTKPYRTDKADVPFELLLIDELDARGVGLAAVLGADLGSVSWA